ncbi:MAG: hypothetical protein JST79_21645 [Acidobacteria bacterium]|jgi:hypothetical protein|nr:hypothetical protein [Acidobacteriota bacterium]
MPVLVVGVIAFVLFGVFGILLTVALIAEHHKSQSGGQPAKWWIASKRH